LRSRRRLARLKPSRSGAGTHPTCPIYLPHPTYATHAAYPTHANLTLRLKPSRSGAGTHPTYATYPSHSNLPLG